MNNVFERVQEILQNVFPDHIIMHNTHFIDGLGMDSIDSMSFVMALEDEFNVNISENDWARVRTVSDVVRIISQEV